MKKNLLLLGFFLFAIKFSSGQENCGNGIDDDGDGLIDCYDNDCKSATVPVGSFFNTANNGAGGTLAGGSPDLNWQVSVGNINGPYVAATVMGTIPPNYYASPWPNCGWISHSYNGNHTTNQDFYYKIEFLLPCSTPCGSAYSDSAAFCLNMDFYADNSVDEIYVNGIAQSAFISGVPATNPYNNPGFYAIGALNLSLCKNWKPGLNTLILKISSSVPTQGFLAQNSTTIAPFTIPDPTILNSIQSICEQSNPINFIAASAGGLWSGSCGGCINASSGVFNPTVASAGTHTIIYTITSPCLAADTITIQVLPTPNAAINPEPPHCEKDAAFNLSAITSGGTWSGVGITNSTMGTFDPTVSVAGIFTVTYIVTAASCSDTATQTITILKQASAMFSANPTVGQVPLTVNFFNASLNANNYLWTFGDGNTSILANPTNTYNSVGTYNACLIASNNSTCPDTACLRVVTEESFSFVVPNVFTPNNDENNDVFYFQSTGIKSLHVEIYNRWGLRMYEWNTIHGGWDGYTVSGKKAVDGTYYFIAKVSGADGKEYVEKGAFTLLK